MKSGLFTWIFLSQLLQAMSELSIIHRMLIEALQERILKTLLRSNYISILNYNFPTLFYNLDTLIFLYFYHL